MTRDVLIDCLRDKEGKPISIHHKGGTIMGNFEYLIWDTDVPVIKGVKIDTCDTSFKPDDIIEIKDAPMYPEALKMMRKLNEECTEDDSIPSF